MKSIDGSKFVKTSCLRKLRGGEALKVVLMPSLWNHVVLTLKGMPPLIRVFTL